MSSDEQRWQAVCARDRTADGSFVYVVSTTGVICHPSCPSRRAKRENVQFFDTLALAQAAGFRPCRRCRPEQPRPSSTRIAQACALLDASDAQTSQVAAQLGISASYLSRLFKRETGLTPQQYRRRRQTERARQHLAEEPSVGHAVFAAGYRSASRFYEGLGPELGMKPREAQQGAKGQRIVYCTTTCSLGRVLIAWTDAGVCRVDLGDTGATVEALHDRFSRAEVVESADGPWINLVVATLDGGTPADLPLDLRGTVFQEQVWQVLRDIPPGQVRTYTAIARALGKPRSARAIARACATNEIAVIIPCHRVIRADGRLAGYRWGLDLKHRLLEREHAPIQGRLPPN